MTGVGAVNQIYRQRQLWGGVGLVLVVIVTVVEVRVGIVMAMAAHLPLISCFLTQGKRLPRRGGHRRIWGPGSE